MKYFTTSLFHWNL